jgi:hypothetical protein
MANYLPMVINQSTNQWLLSLREGSIDTWAQLRRAFIDNYMATCQQPSNKYDLEKVRDNPNEPLRDYIRRFTETWISIPNINSDEAISVAEPPKLYGPHAPIIVLKTSDGYACTPDNLRRSVGCPYRTPIQLHFTTHTRSTKE